MTSNASQRAAIARECDHIAIVLKEKNRAYGDSALSPLRVFSRASLVEQLLVRIDDKLSRMALGCAAEEDAEFDLLGYLILLRIARARAAAPPSQTHYTQVDIARECGLIRHALEMASTDDRNSQQLRRQLDHEIELARTAEDPQAYDLAMIWTLVMLRVARTREDGQSSPPPVEATTGGAGQDSVRGGR